jgi:hypothetical protein
MVSVDEDPIMRIFESYEDGLPNDLDSYATFDASTLPDEAKTNPSYSHAYTSGRQLENLRTRLQFGEYYEADSTQYIRKILSELVLIEVVLISADINEYLIDDIEKKRRNLASEYENEDDIIREKDKYRLLDDVTDWLYTLSGEWMSRRAFPTSIDTRIKIEEIVADPSSFFGTDVWDWMERFPKEDFHQACKCLIVDSPTASTMLSLRAVEYCLRIWYEESTGREIEQRTWGQVVGELEDNYGDTNSRPAVLSNLDYLRNRRNAVSHPEDSPTIREAERMLYRTEGTISEIYRQIG